MKFIYPAVFHKQEDGTFKGYFPDLTGCEVTGSSLDDAIEEANAAACDWIALELEDGAHMLPACSDEDDLDLKEGDIFRNICANIRLFDGYDE